MQDGTPGNESDDVLTLTVMARLKRVGREMRMLVENTDDLRNIARKEQVSGAYVYCLLRLPTLAPDIVTAIINGKNPAPTHGQEVDATDTADTGRLD